MKIISHDKMNPTIHGHIKLALMTAVNHAKEIGTDLEIGQAEYALKMLNSIETGSAPYSRFMAEQCAIHGCD